MIELIISFKGREFAICTYLDGSRRSLVICDDAASLLPAKIEEALIGGTKIVDAADLDAKIVDAASESRAKIVDAADLDAKIVDAASESRAKIAAEVDRQARTSNMHKAHPDHTKIRKVAFLIGPGSFTSIKIVCSFCSAMRLAMPDVCFMPVRLDEAVGALYPHPDISFRCNHTLWHRFYNGEWRIDTSPGTNTICIDDPSWSAARIAEGIAIHALGINASQNFEPFYGLDLFS